MGIEVQLIVASVVAGILTILAPCVIPVLPVVLGRSTTETKEKLRPLIITGSLMASIFAFTILLRASTVFINVPLEFWQIFAGIILITYGLFSIFPDLWDFISVKLNLSTKSNILLAKSAKKQGVYGDILIGASLGPVFTSCSPTYAVIVGIVLSGDVGPGVFYLLFYLLGLGAVMLAIALAGQKLVKNLGWATDPNGVFKKVVGVVFIIVGIFIITGIDKTIATWVIEGGLYDWIIRIESNFTNGKEQAVNLITARIS